MDKQTTLAFILMGVILVVWLYFNSPEPQPQVANQPDTTLVKTKTDEAKETNEISTKAPVKTAQEESVKIDDANELPTLFGQTEKEGQIITIETDLVKLEMTSKGGKISNREAQLHFKDTYSAQVGQTLNDLDAVRFSQDEEPLYNGIQPARFDNGSDWLLSTYVVQAEPMPCTVLAMIVDVEVN